MNGDHELGIDLQLEHEQYNEKCGVFGVYVRAPLLFSPPCVVFVRRSRYLILPQNVEQAADTTYYGMVGLQHRGQEGAGLVSVAHNKAGVACDFKLHRGHGLVTDVFKAEDMKDLGGIHAIGHTRYSTAGGKSQIEGFQPFCVKYRMGNIALAHNGNLSNAPELRSFFENQGVLTQSTVDSELFLHLISHSKRQSQVDQIFDAMTQAEGAFSVIIITEKFMCAVRDPNGFRPLCIGRLKGRGLNGTDGYCVASETCALDLCKADYVRDVLPGLSLFSCLPLILAQTD